MCARLNHIKTKRNLLYTSNQLMIGRCVLFWLVFPIANLRVIRWPNYFTFPSI